MSNKQMVSYAETFEAGGTLIPPAGWRPRWKKEFEGLVAIVFRAGQAAWPQRQKKIKGRLTDQQRDTIDRLCAQRDQIAAGLDIESSLIGSRSTLEQVVAEPAADGLLMDWQKDLLKASLDELKATEVAAAAE
jgi:ribonuclease D